MTQCAFLPDDAIYCVNACPISGTRGDSPRWTSQDGAATEGHSGGPLGGRVKPTAWSSADQQAGNPACPGTENLQPNLGSATTVGVRMSSPAGFTPLVTQFTKAAKAASSSGTANPQ